MLLFSHFSPSACSTPLSSWDTSLPKIFSCLFFPFMPKSCFYYSAFLDIYLNMFTAFLQICTYSHKICSIIHCAYVFKLHQWYYAINHIVLLTFLLITLFLKTYPHFYFYIYSISFYMHMILYYKLICHILHIHSSIDECNSPSEKKIKDFVDISTWSQGREVLWDSSWIVGYTQT